MSYPLVFAFNGDHFARVNHDGTWSILWNKARFVASEKQSTTPKNNMAIVACASVLLAAKDNFYVTPWEKSEEWKDMWSGKSITLDIDPEISPCHLQMTYENEVIIQVNGDGTWSINWDLVKKAYTENSNKKTSSFCQMLLAARYNFPTKPWESDEDDDDEDDY